MITRIRAHGVGGGLIQGKGRSEISNVKNQKTIIPTN